MEEISFENNLWVSAYLYHQEPWESILLNAVCPFIQSLRNQKKTDKYFFIRYWENGPHVRLRVKALSNDGKNEIQTLTKDYFENFFQSSSSIRNEEYPLTKLNQNNRIPTNSIVYRDYIPEIDRYGGKYGVLIAERQFMCSSEAVFSILRENPDWSYNFAMGSAIQFHLGFVHALKMSTNEAVFFFSSVCMEWLPTTTKFSYTNNEPNGDAPMESFKKLFAKDKANLVRYVQSIWQALKDGEEFEQEWLNKWVLNMKEINVQLKNLFEKKLLSVSGQFQNKVIENSKVEERVLWSIYRSYLHMTNNRLGINNQDEAYLAYILKECLVSL